MFLISDNLNLINQNIKFACERSGRDVSEITLIGVTKTIEVSRMKELLDLSIYNFGENKVQELLNKYDYFDERVKWHLIGHLQTNKVKNIIDKVDLIHSVDSFKLALEINNRAMSKNLVKDILIQVNVAEEQSKFGVVREDLISLIEKISTLTNIRVTGLMTVAPFVENPEDNRIHFRNLKILFDESNKLNYENVCMKNLSMGMTNDYAIAIEEGSTMIRIGTGIFGCRNY